MKSPSATQEGNKPDRLLTRAQAAASGLSQQKRTASQPGSEKAAQQQGPNSSESPVEELQASLSGYIDELCQRAFADVQQKLKDSLSELIKKEVNLQVSAAVTPLQEEIAVLKVEVGQLRAKLESPQEERLQSSQECSTSQAETPGQTARQTSARQLESVVRQLASCQKQHNDQKDQEARQERQLKAVLRNLPQSEDETADSLTNEVNALLSEKLGTVVKAAGVKRTKKSGQSAAPGIVLVQFSSKEDKRAVFKARSKLAGTQVGLDDDLTPLQQERKRAAWPAFKAFKAKSVKTQWRAEKLFYEDNGRFVEHKLLSV